MALDILKMRYDGKKLVTDSRLRSPVLAKTQPGHRAQITQRRANGKHKGTREPGRARPTLGLVVHLPHQSKLDVETRKEWEKHSSKMNTLTLDAIFGLLQ